MGIHLEIEPSLNAGTIINKDGYITQYKEQTIVPDEMLLFFKDPHQTINCKDLMFWDEVEQLFCVVRRIDEVDFDNHKFLGHIDNVRCSGGQLQLCLFLRHSY